MERLLFILLMMGLQLFYWWIGQRSSRKIEGRQDYFLAGRSVRFFPLMMTFLATQVGGGLVLGAAEEAYHYGWLVIMYPLGASLGLMVLGFGVGRRLARFSVSTVAEIFEVFYRSPDLKKVASLMSIVSLFMILIAQIIASHKFFVSMGLDNLLLFLLFWVVVVIYTSQGGLRAVISTDIAQAAIFTLVFFFTFVFVFWMYPSAGMTPKFDVQVGALFASKWSGWLLMPLLFMVIEQDMGQRCFAGASPSIVSKASLISGIFALAVGVIPVFFGVLAREIYVDIPPGGSVLMTTVARTTTPLVTAIVACAVLAAIISTATSLINAIGSNVAHDFFSSAKERSMRWIRSMTAIISISAIAFAFYFDNIVNLLIESYELSVSALFVSLFFALFKTEGNRISAILSISLGTASFFLCRQISTALPRELFSIGLSFLGYVAGEAIVYIQKRELSTRFLE